MIVLELVEHGKAAKGVLSALAVYQGNSVTWGGGAGLVSKENRWGGRQGREEDTGEWEQHGEK